MAQTVENTQDDLSRRYGAAVRVVGAAILLTLLLVALALSGVLDGALGFNPMAANVLRISIIFLAFGAFAFRRTKFSAMRLQDIAALRGTSGLLETLQWTTISVALIGVVIALCGFAVSLMIGYWLETILLGGVALVVLFYCYPRRAAWQRVVEALGEEATGGAGRAAKGTIA